MATDRANDPHAFRDFLDARLSNGPDAPTLDEILDLWVHENSFEEERREAVEAVRLGLEDMYAGRTRPHEQFDREFRERHGLPPRA